MNIVQKYNQQIGRFVDIFGIIHIEPSGFTRGQLAQRQAYGHQYAINRLWVVVQAILLRHSLIMSILSKLPNIHLGVKAGMSCILIASLVFALSVIYEAGFRVGVAEWDHLYAV